MIYYASKKLSKGHLDCECSCRTSNDGAAVSGMQWLFVILSLIVISLPLSVQGEARDQTFTISEGWNSVFLVVEPSSLEPESVFAGVERISSVWAWNPALGSVEFIQDPSELTPEDPRMLAWFPDNPLVSNLHAIHGGRAYLIHREGTGDVEWTVTGEPVVPDIEWKPNSFNLVGFPLEAGNEPFYEAFFEHSPAHAGQKIWRLDNASGQ